MSCAVLKRLEKELTADCPTVVTVAPTVVMAPVIILPIPPFLIIVKRRRTTPTPTTAPAPAKFAASVIIIAPVTRRAPAPAPACMLISSSFIGWAILANV
jgi:hypothetical protein